MAGCFVFFGDAAVTPLQSTSERPPLSKFGTMTRHWHARSVPVFASHVFSFLLFRGLLADLDLGDEPPPPPGTSTR
jgi:hypothetical protein